MRIISQAGLGMDYDIPYEEAVLKRYGEVILCASKHLDREVTIATYSTEAKAIKAMEMLRGAYVGKLIRQNVDLSDDKVAEIMKNWNMGAITVANFDTTRVDYINNTVFQFPKDEEIEIENQQAVGKD